MELDGTTILMLLAFVIGLALIFAALLKKQVKGLKFLNPVFAGVLGVILIIPGFFYGVQPMLPTADTQVVIVDDSAAIPYAQFNVDTYANGTANDIDNSSVSSSGLVFTTPFVRNTTGNTMEGTSAAAMAHGSVFADPIYNFSVRPIATQGVTADDLVTLKFSAVDPGECITSSGTDYRLIAEDDDSDPYLYWKVVDASDGTTLQDWVSTSGTVSFLYTDSIYVWLNVVYQDSGCSRMTDFTTKSTTATLSNLDGSWSQTYTIQVMPIASRT